MSDSAEHRFDRWTRRRFGSAASLAVGLTAAGVGLSTGEAGNKHKHKKKKKKHKKKGHEPGCLEEECVNPGEICNPNGSPCCLCFNCIRLNENAPYSCSPIDLDE